MHEHHVFKRGRFGIDGRGKDVSGEVVEDNFVDAVEREGDSEKGGNIREETLCDGLAEESEDGIHDSWDLDAYCGES